ncbi:hypothetical protein RB195_003081 [Necator americanus]|uniref:Sema domain-containing protein n=1 Tax=Necator americanus TaxID=51031 RepID=A0ABR1DLZ6_NECAM
MRKTVDQCPVDIVPAPSGRLLTDLEYGDDAVIFAARNLNMSTLYRSSLQPMDYVYALINADVGLFETSDGNKRLMDKRTNSAMSSIGL